MFGDKSTDRLLRDFAARLIAFGEREQASGRFSDVFLARVGTDEFLAVVRGDRAGLGLERLAEDFLAELRAPFEIGSARVTLAAHLGIAACPDHGADYESLRTNADIATEAAKRQGRSSFAVFTTTAGEAAQERLAIEHDLRDAVRERGFNVHYQPKVSCSDGSILGVEALARWSHPQRGFIPPGKFIPIAEETGLLPEIGLFVLERAMEDIGRILSEGLSITLAVNVSVQQLEDPGFSEAVLAVVERTKFSPKALELEITESLAMQDSEIVQRQIKELRQTGIQIAIDDFGTGYCNLAMLSRLPIDTIKLDRSLVQDVHVNPEKQAIVRTVIALARSFGFHTVVEGVETHAELDYLVREGAEMAQGYLFSPPVTIETINLLLKPKDLDGLLKDGQDEPAPNVVAYPGNARRKA
jgi:predicted signal transduction protein with EAL and GGDEF domain